MVEQIILNVFMMTLHMMKYVYKYTNTCIRMEMTNMMVSLRPPEEISIINFIRIHYKTVPNSAGPRLESFSPFRRMNWSITIKVYGTICLVHLKRVFVANFPRHRCFACCFPFSSKYGRPAQLNSSLRRGLFEVKHNAGLTPRLQYYTNMRLN